MTKGLRRIYGFGHLHFITFSCYRRLPLLGAPRSRSIFVDVLEEIRDRHKFKLVGYVVMPEHVHLLMSEPEIGTPSTALQMLKQSAARRLLKGPTLTNRGLGTRTSKPNNPPSGRSGFMISMCGLKRRRSKSLRICT